MKIENEGRVLNINVEETLSRLRSNHIQFRCAYFQKRYVYDFHPPVKGKWIRLRTNGAEITLTIKEITDNGVSGTKELEIVVSDFDKTNEIMEQLGYSPKGHQENFRIEFQGEGFSADIDFWPFLQPYLEIEADSPDMVFKVFKLLGFGYSQVTGENVDTIYQNHGIDLDSIYKLAFDDVERNTLIGLMEELGDNG